MFLDYWIFVGHLFHSIMYMILQAKYYNICNFSGVWFSNRLNKLQKLEILKIRDLENW